MARDARYEFGNLLFIFIKSCNKTKCKHMSCIFKRCTSDCVVLFTLLSCRIAITHVTADISLAKRSTLQHPGKQPVIQKKGNTQAGLGKLFDQFLSK